MSITKAIIPAAGLGTRFLPFTKAVPKEMLPLLTKPAIQYIIEEGLNANINQFYMITNRSKHAMSDYFDQSDEFAARLKERNKEKLLDSLTKIMRTAQFTYIRQSEPLGLGHAVLMAKNVIGKEYFGIMLPDDIIISKDPGIAQLIRVAMQEKASVIAVQEVPEDCVSSYGIVAIKKQITPNLFHVSDLIEKPAKKDAPSNLAIIGRYVLSYKIFKALEDISTYAVDELQLTNGITQMLKNNEKVFAYKVQGTRFDVGNPIGWVKAVISLALQDPYYAPHIKDFLCGFDTTNSMVYNPTKNISHRL